MVDKTKVDYISSYVSKLMRKNFGRGPQSCQAFVSRNHVVIYIRGFLAPMEEILLKRGHSKEVDYARKLIIRNLLEEIKGVIQVTLEEVSNEYYDDWNYPNNTGVLVFVFAKEEEQSVIADLDIPKLESEISRISLLVQKVPNKIHTYSIHPSVYIIERIGILIQIEKALVERGFEQELRFTKDELEKSYFHRFGRFEDIFRKQVRDIFVDWNFNKDKSLMVFILESSQ